jgi:hypothetical protein
MPDESPRIERGVGRVVQCMAPVAALVLLAGIGALGWLAAHVLTYDAIGASSLHSGHEYMRPIGEGGAGLALLGFALAVIALVVARRPFASWLRSSMQGDDGDVAYLLAALVPASSFFVVELAEGATSSAGELVLLVGMPLQALLGMAVLWLVRELLFTLADVVEWFVGDARRAVRTPLVLAAHRRAVPAIRRSPMAASAPRRGPPRR